MRAAQVRFFGGLALMALLPALVIPGAAQAQEPVSYPPAYSLFGVEHIYQDWNNCGPATLSMALTYYTDATIDQHIAANWLKPNYEDKNVSPWQMAAYVNTQLGGNLRAIVRQGGDLNLLKTLIANNFPVLIEEGYNPPELNQGWMGHYLMMSGYDDAAGQFITQDSYEGPNLPYSYDHINEFWRNFNRLYLVVYPVEREAELMALLGSDADERQNWVNALEEARAEAVANPQDPFAWFNMGTSFVGLEMYGEAAVAFDQARNVGEGLPWRMMWYQFGPFEAYMATGRYQDVIDLARANLDDGGGQYVEETYYYAGLARAALGETERAISNLDGAISFNPNFTPAREAKAELQGS
ncbi:MAG: C39 family peptidase [Anaerolineae bacterium]|nr:C39 family peptidase [Anaerolineae bacterium]